MSLFTAPPSPSYPLAQQGYYPFHWDGTNTHAGRLAAAEKLAKLFHFIGASDPSARIHLLAHSHGGNVLLKVTRGEGGREGGREAWCSARALWADGHSLRLIGVAYIRECPSPVGIPHPSHPPTPQCLLKTHSWMKSQEGTREGFLRGRMHYRLLATGSGGEERCLDGGVNNQQQ